jgi:hypothetical protein
MGGTYLFLEKGRHTPKPILIGPNLIRPQLTIAGWVGGQHGWPMWYIFLWKKHDSCWRRELGYVLTWTAVHMHSYMTYMLLLPILDMMLGGLVNLKCSILSSCWQIYILKTHTYNAHIGNRILLWSTQLIKSALGSWRSGKKIKELTYWGLLFKSCSYIHFSTCFAVQRC